MDTEKPKKKRNRVARFDDGPPVTVRQKKAVAAKGRKGVTRKAPPTPIVSKRTRTHTATMAVRRGY